MRKKMSEFIDFGLYEQPNSGGMNGKQFTYIFSGIGKGRAREAFESLWGDSALVPLFRGSPVLRSQCSIARAGYIETLTIVTGPLNSSGGGGESTEDGFAEFSLETNRIEKAIETHPNYKVCWSRDLFYAAPSNGKTVKIPDEPEWYRNSKRVPDRSDPNWVAAKEWPADAVIGGIQKHFVLAASRTKEGVEVYPVNAPIVTEYKHFTSLSAAKKNLRIANHLCAPGETFDYSSADICWLVNPDGIVEENGEYVTRNTYQYADQWDTDIYEFA